MCISTAQWLDLTAYKNLTDPHVNSHFEKHWFKATLIIISVILCWAFDCFHQTPSDYTYIKRIISPSRPCFPPGRYGDVSEWSICKPVISGLITIAWKGRVFCILWHANEPQSEKLIESKRLCRNEKGDPDDQRDLFIVPPQ